MLAGGRSVTTRSEENTATNNTQRGIAGSALHVSLILDISRLGSSTLIKEWQVIVPNL